MRSVLARALAVPAVLLAVLAASGAAALAEPSGQVAVVLGTGVVFPDTGHAPSRGDAVRSDDNLSGLGAGLYALPNAGLGLYANVHAARTPADPGGSAPGYAMNVGVTRPVTRGLALYAGLGIGPAAPARTSAAPRTAARRTTEAPAAAPDPAPTLGANVNVGAVVSAGALSVDAGFNTALDQGYLGVGFRF